MAFFLYRSNFRTLSILAAAGVAAATAHSLTADAADGPRDQSGANMAHVPPMPDGTPRQLLDYTERLRKQAVASGSTPDALPAQKALAAAAVKAAERALAQLEPSDELALAAVRVKFDALDTLGVGDRKASATRRDFAKSLCDSPTPTVAHEARLRLLAAEVLEMHWQARGDGPRTTDGGAALLDLATAILAEHPDDDATAARLALWAGSLEFVPGDGAGLARLAYGKLAPMFAASGNPKIRARATRMDAQRLRLELAGKPIEIVGTLLDGTRFDPVILERKVVIVDFWATWCGPCMAEIPALRKLHNAHRDSGLEIVLVSLDDDADAVKAFVTESRVTWPILFGGATAKFSHPLAARYGITRIPQQIVVGRDGKVVSIHYDSQSLAKTVEALLRP